VPFSSGGTSISAAHPVEVVLDPLVVNRNDIVQRTRCSLGHGGSFSLTWAFSHRQFSQIRGRQPYLNVRKTLYVIAPAGLTRAVQKTTRQ
jgi:hypothetical protein